MNYTKGKWIVKIIDATIPKHHSVFARIEPSIGYVGWDSMGVYDDPAVAGSKRELKTLNNTAIANANLIAAAPDMYEALKTIADEYIQNQGSDGKTCPHPKEFISCITPNGIPDYWEKVKLAIAKAEGENEMSKL